MRSRSPHRHVVRIAWGGCPHVPLPCPARSLLVTGSSDASDNASSTSGDGTWVSGGGWGEFDPDSMNGWGTPEWDGWGTAGWDPPDAPSQADVPAQPGQTTNAGWASAGAAAAGTTLAILAFGIIIRVALIFL
ncbi:hypothetical protein GGX14DRAFT_406946 [Mycena pura]|uniref:Uncharacterized protein n=1 Tax=Mycena pura TaxID=153505 RepID=A0AAD6UP22_9AGAR|nr:hypothetical protein GGX14DRAFT_406946 [Mycena pura]